MAASAFFKPRNSVPSLSGQHAPATGALCPPPTSALTSTSATASASASGETPLLAAFREQKRAACAICLESLIATLPVSSPHQSCAHRFHPACLGTWAVTARRCPQCRSPFEALAHYANADDNSPSRIEHLPAVKAKAEDAGEAEDNDDDDDLPCAGCGEAAHEESLLLCDGCDAAAWHTFCLSPRLDAVPEGDWFCPACVRRRQKRPPGRAESRRRGYSADNGFVVSDSSSSGGSGSSSGEADSDEGSGSGSPGSRRLRRRRRVGAPARTAQRQAAARDGRATETLGSDAIEADAATSAVADTGQRPRRRCLQRVKSLREPGDSDDDDAASGGDGDDGDASLSSGCESEFAPEADVLEEEEDDDDDELTEEEEDDDDAESDSGSDEACSEQSAGEIGGSRRPAKGKRFADAGRRLGGSAAPPPKRARGKVASLPTEVRQRAAAAGPVGGSDASHDWLNSLAFTGRRGLLAAAAEEESEATQQAHAPDATSAEGSATAAADAASSNEASDGPAPTATPSAAAVEKAADASAAQHSQPCTQGSSQHASPSSQSAAGAAASSAAASPTPQTDGTTARLPKPQPQKLESVFAAFQFQASSSRRRKPEATKLH